MSELTWIYEKFRGDMAIYGICPICNSYKNFSRFINGKIEMTKPYNYCPTCGNSLYHDDDKAFVIWDERAVDVLYTDDDYQRL